MTKSKTVSLEDLNLSKQCEDAFEFEYIDPAGSKTGIYISVIGSNAEKVRQFSIAEANKVRKEAALKGKRKDNEFTPIEDDIEYFIRDAANRIVAWRGIDQECNAENAEYLCRVNSEIRRQVVEASNELSNFTRSK